MLFRWLNSPHHPDPEFNRRMIGNGWTNGEAGKVHFTEKRYGLGDDEEGDSRFEFEVK